MKTTFAALAIMGLAATAGAQVVTYTQVVPHEQAGTLQQAHEQKLVAEKQAQLQFQLQKATETGIHITFDMKPVTGAPYSGEAVTESVQSLTDGNRIVKKTSARVYRDGKGRTRKETIGPDGQVTSVFISDPSTGKSFVLNPGSNVATVSSVATFIGPGSTGVAGGTTGGGTVTIHSTGDAQKDQQLKIVQEAKLQSHVTTGQATAGVAGGVSWVSAGGKADAPSTKVDLGQQSFDGVIATGTRTTTVIAAGAIGNEQPITIVSEEWFSNDLKVLVMTKHSDPRAGETTYKLTGIIRAEPNPSLFELPAGTTVK